MSEPKKRLSTPLYFESQDQKDRFQKAAIASGKGSEKKPNVTGWLRSLGEAACVAEAEVTTGPGCWMESPPAITFESMTAGEQWYFLSEICESDVSEATLWRANELRNRYPDLGRQLAEAMRDYPQNDSTTPGYQARYDAALAYVKGVVDGE